MNPSAKINKFTRLFKHHAQKNCGEAQIPRTFVHESAKEGKLKSLEEAKIEE